MLWECLEVALVHVLSPMHLVGRVGTATNKPHVMFLKRGTSKPDIKGSLGIMILINAL